MAAKKKYPKKFLELLQSVTAKRPRTVIQHILKHGFITTEDLQNQYGYEHPPRAARDVRELGIPLETYQVKNKQGRSIAAYRFGDPSKIRHDKLDERKIIPKKFTKLLTVTNGARCHICREEFDERFLQVDHRVPYEVAGDRTGERDIADYMLLCGSCNRAKSWSCEHCPNWKEEKDGRICLRCYWASPESYKHISLKQERRVAIIWKDDEIAIYEKLVKKAQEEKVKLPVFVKTVLSKSLSDR